MCKPFNLGMYVALLACLSCVTPPPSAVTPTPQAATATPVPTATSATITPSPVVGPSATSVVSVTPDPSTQGNDARMAGDAALAEVITHSSEFLPDVTYCAPDGVEQKMDVYLPKVAAEGRPLAVFIHGGGWSSGDKRAVAAMDDIPSLLDAGFAVASLAYRLAPEYRFPAMIEDVKCAIRSLRAHAQDYGFDPEHIGAWGISAGAHLGSMLAVTDQAAGFDVGEHDDQSSRIQAMVDMSGPADLTQDFSPAFIRLKSQVYGDLDMLAASPIHYVSADDAPFLIMQGENDIVVPLRSRQTKGFYDALRNAGVPAQILLVKGGSHTLDAPGQSPSRAELTQMIVRFFQQNLK